MNPATWLPDSIVAHNLRKGILPNMRLVVKYQYNNISFHLRLIPGKTNDKIFQKIQKNLFWDHFGPFLPKFGQKWIFLEKRPLSVVKYCAEENPMSHSGEKCWTDRWTDRQMDNGDFIGNFLFLWLPWEIRIVTVWYLFVNKQQVRKIGSMYICQCM